MDKSLLSILACPSCKGSLVHVKEKKELICLFDRLAFSVKDGMPVMLVNEAREVSLEEKEALAKQA